MWIALLAAAHAFRPPEVAWSPDHLPLRIEVPDPTCPLEPGDCLAAAQLAAEHWAAIPCIRADAEVVAGSEIGGPDDRVNQLWYSDPFGTLSQPPYYSYTLFTEREEVDFLSANWLRLITREDLVEGPCDYNLDLMQWSTLALGKMFLLEDPTFYGPAVPFDFWLQLEWCDTLKANLEPPAPAGVFDFPSGIEVECGPIDHRYGIVLGRAPFDVTCTATLSAQDGFFEPYDDIVWDFGDGHTARGTEVTHTYLEDGLHQIVASGEVGGADCGPVRGVGVDSATVCPLLQPRLTTDEPRGLTIHVRNHLPLGASGCEVEASWTVFEGPDTTGAQIFETTAWSPFLELPSGGTYTAQVTLSTPEGDTGEGSITFDVRRELQCSQAPVAPAWWGLVLWFTLRRRRGA